MSSAAQAKILRAVEYGEFERLGSESLQVADVRLMSATHLPLRRFLETEQFRKDLFYRISGIQLTIPPLRERPADLRSLVAGEVELACRVQQKTIVGLETRAADLLFSYHWPGNLRELKRVVHAAVALSPERVLTVESILLERFDEPGTSPSADERSGTPAALGTGAGSSSPGPAAGWRQPTTGPREPIGETLEGDLSLRTAELRHIRRVLERMGGNKRAAARVLGLSRSTLDRKLTAFLD
jgi:transcriptional regulator with PAS, ATPase and Fis domain